jgi:hypothetical protein
MPGKTAQHVSLVTLAARHAIMARLVAARHAQHQKLFKAQHQVSAFQHVLVTCGRTEQYVKHVIRIALLV